jgi:hypothetical protein
MKRLICFCVLIFGLSAAASLAQEPTPGGGAAGAAPAVQGTFTIGDFALQVAHALDLTPADRSGFTPASAAFALWQNGVRLRSSLADPLTEEDLTSALRQLGFNLTPSVPERVVSEDRSSLVLSTFVNSSTVERLRRSSGSAAAPRLASGGNPGDDFNNGNGKGGKFKRKGPKSPGSGESLTAP